MTTKIFEEFPSRRNDRSASSSPERKGGSGPTDMKGRMEKKVRQAVYDIRYRARREGIDVKQAYSQYMQNSSLNGQERNLVKAKIFGRPMAEDYKIEEFASSSVAKALFKVFVEGVEEESILGGEYIQELNNMPDKKYKVRVTDKNGTSYVRYATREKISDLRANPNIESVEMTEYGEPYEGERKKGSQTARVAAGGGLDPVGKEDSDVNNDGKVDKTDKYLMKRRGAIGNAIATRKEEFIHEAGRKKKSDEPKRFDVRTDISNKVNTSPTQGGNEKVSIVAHNELEGELIAETGYSKFLKKVHSLEEMSVSINQQQAAGAALGAKRGETDPSELKGAAREMYDSMTEKQLRDFAKTEHKGLPEKVKEEMDCGSNDDKKKKIDPRQLKTIKSRMRTTLGLMGIKASYEPEGELVDESRLGDRAKKIEDAEAEKGGLRRTKSNREKIAGGIRRSQNVDLQGDLGRQKAPKDTGLHKGATRPSSEDDETPRRNRRRDDNPALTARDRNPNLR